MLRLANLGQHSLAKKNIYLNLVNDLLFRSFSQNKSTNTKLLIPVSLQYDQSRNTNFFNRHTAKQIWAGVTGVSNAGRKRGRGRGPGKALAKDLNRGQIIGVGKANIVWPGLTSPVIRGRELVEKVQLPPDPDREAKLISIRDSLGQGKRKRVAPLERGWSGGKMGGRSLGPPDDVGDAKFEGFDSKVLEYKSVFCMKKCSGRYRRMSAMVVTGNGNGLAGFALGKSVDGKTALRNAKNRAGQKLIYLERYENHTVLHDFAAQFFKTRVIVEKKPRGTGLVCHRIIQEICKAVGIKDIRAKVEGSTNAQSITKAFFLGLMQQKTHQKLADEQKLHLVEFSEENDNYPIIKASPTTECLKDSSKAPDFNVYVMGGKVVKKKKKYPPFFTQLIHDPYWPNNQLKKEKHRSHYSQKVQLIAEHGKVASFLTSKYPECQYEQTMPEEYRKSKDE